MTVIIRSGHYPLAVEIYAADGTYLAGFPNPGAKEKAQAYVQAKGWSVAE